MNTVDRRSHWFVRVLSSLLLPVLLAAGCAHNSVAEERGDPPSDPRTASPVRMMDDDGTPNLSRDRSVWPAAVVQPQDIEFLCSDNRYLRGQFKLRIADDLGDNSGIRECKHLPAELKGMKSVLWIVVPALAKTRRDVEYIYETPSDVRIDVRSRPIIRVKVVAFDRRDGSCADGSFETTGPESRFWMPHESDVAKDESDHALRHAKEASSVQLHLSDIHEGARSALTPHEKHFCHNLFKEFDAWPWSIKFNALLRLWASTPRTAIESLARRIHSPIREMESVVRIHGSLAGSGFYIADTNGGHAESAESTLVLTNYHIVKHARHGAVRVWTLNYESMLHALDQLLPWMQTSDEAEQGPSPDALEQLDPWMQRAEEGEEGRFPDYFPDFPGTVIFYDEHRDLALVRVSHPGPPLALYQEPPLPPGIHEVMALGHPKEFEFYATKGIVSRIILNCKRLSDQPNKPLSDQPLKCVEHDAATNVGNSGGPLLLLRNGRRTSVLGVNKGGSAAVFPSERGGKIQIPYAGLSTAIHYEEIRGFLDEFMKFRSSD